MNDSVGEEGNSDIDNRVILNDFGNSDCDSFIDGNEFYSNSEESELSDEELIVNEKINEQLTPDNANIYENANISLSEFRLAFLLLQQKLSLKPCQARLVYDFIKSILPRENNLSTFTKLMAKVKSEKAKQTKACLVCCRTLAPNIQCNNKFCLSQKKTKSLSKYKDPLCIKFDFHKHLQYILTNKFDSLYTYQGNFNKNGSKILKIKASFRLTFKRRTCNQSFHNRCLQCKCIPTPIECELHFFDFIFRCSTFYKFS